MLIHLRNRLKKNRQNYIKKLLNESKDYIELTEKEYVLYDEEYYDMNDEIFFKRFIDELDELYDIQDTLRSEWKLSYDILEWL